MMLSAVTPPMLGPPHGGAGSIPPGYSGAGVSPLIVLLTLLVILAGLAMSIVLVHRARRERRSLDPELREEFFAQVHNALRDPILVNQARRQVRSAKRE